MECFSCILHFLFWRVFPWVVCWNRSLFTAKWMSHPWEICVPLFIVHVNAQFPLISLCISFFLLPVHMAPQQEHSFVCVEAWNRFNIFVFFGHALHLNHGPHLGGVPVWRENNVFLTILINFWWKPLTPQRNLLRGIFRAELKFSQCEAQTWTFPLFYSSCWVASCAGISLL